MSHSQTIKVFTVEKCQQNKTDNISNFVYEQTEISAICTYIYYPTDLFLHNIIYENDKYKNV